MNPKKYIKTAMTFFTPCQDILLTIMLAFFTVTGAGCAYADKQDDVMEKLRQFDASQNSKLWISAEETTGIKHDSEVERYQNIGKLNLGASFCEVEKLLGTWFHYEFKAKIKDKEYVCVSWRFVKLLKYYFIFEDDRLSQILSCLPLKSVIVNYDGKNVETHEPVSPINLVDMVLKSESMTISDVQDGIGKHVERRNFSANPIIKSAVESYIFRSKDKTKKDYATNRELIAKYSPTRIKLGMGIEEVKGILGNPSLVFNDDGNLFYIFGNYVYLPYVGVNYKFSKLAVVFCEEKVKYVFCYSFVSLLNSYASETKYEKWVANGDAEFYDLCGNLIKIITYENGKKIKECIPDSTH